jgi:hypothetical protein
MRIFPQLSSNRHHRVMNPEDGFPAHHINLRLREELSFPNLMSILIKQTLFFTKPKQSPHRILKNKEFVLLTFSLW